jgi:nucleotide-binding universal stress UspA family protein
MIRAPDSRPVVVGINGPQHTYRRAVAFALREATLRHSAIRLVHGCQPLGGRGPARSEHIAQEQRQARRQLRAAAQLARQFSADDASVVCCIYPGSGVEALFEESRTAALVVTQRRELSMLRGLPVGSTIGAVTAVSRCPIVVLKPDSVQGHPRAGVVVSIDDSFGDQYALQVGFEEARLRATHLTVMSIGISPSSNLSADASQAAAGDGRLGRRDVGRGVSQTLARYGQLFPHVVVRHHAVDRPDIADVVKASIGAELLIVGRGPRAAGRSVALSAVARECVDAAACPVMIVGSG